MKERFKYTLAIIAFPVILYGILGPLEIFVSNFGEMLLDFNDFFWGFLGMSLAMTLLLTLLIGILPERINKSVNLIVFAFSISSYIQNMFLNGKLVTSDGSDMDWSGYGQTFIVNGIVWAVIFLACIAAFIFLKDKWIKIMNYVSVFITCVLAITVISLIITSPKSHDNGYQLDEKEQFVLAKSDNIIVIVLDRYGNERFEKVADMYPEIKDCLKDFTYYNNADSRYSNTFPSMPHIMTGIDRDYSMSEEDWREGIWKADSTKNYYKTIHDNGYTVHLYSPYASTCYGNVSNLEGMVDNIRPSKIYKDYRLIYTLLEKASIYRYVPYAMKPRFEVKSYVYDQMIFTVEAEYRNSEFHEKLLNEGLSVSPDMDKCLMINHILGMHNPFEIDANGMKIDEMPADEEVLIDVTRGLHVILGDYISQLKGLGIYDNATIIITSDHGDYLNDGGLQPIYFIKLPHETHDEMQVNSAPISHDDFVPTILYLMGEDYTDYGTTIFDWKENDRRPRMIDCHEGTTYYTDRFELYKVVKENAVQF